MTDEVRKFAAGTLWRVFCALRRLTLLGVRKRVIGVF